jgi:hypothetical protein
VKLADKGFTQGDWLIGRVVETYPGEDGKVRVVTVLTRGGQLKRPELRFDIGKPISGFLKSFYMLVKNSHYANFHQDQRRSVWKMSPYPSVEEFRLI